ncbi:MAG TPA: C40 family peptidase [Actinomycetota bacterium]|nr:C40 family peptidase [Actinomycetota bacterium]
MKNNASAPRVRPRAALGRTILAVVALAASLHAGPAHAGIKNTPEWALPAVKYLVSNGAIDASSFRANQPMKRSAFKKVMGKTFGGGYTRVKGYVTAAEVSAALVRALGKAPVASRLRRLKSPDGWQPRVDRWFGSEIVSREMGLRRDRATSEESREASAGEPMAQADVAYAVWKAKTSPSTWGADALAGFSLSSYGPVRREVVEYALSLVGTPYVWGGEWAKKTPAGYPYGAQAHGGVDCSGFVWYVLRKKAPGWAPAGRPYAGWAFPERSSADMAAATKERLSYRRLQPGDVVFFAPNGRKSKASAVYHAGLYLGRGWIVHSSGSRAGVSLASIAPGSWWHDQIAWGRRIIRT